MSNFFVAIPLFVFSVLGYAAQTVCGECMTPTINSQYSEGAETVALPNADATAAKASAEAFADRVDTLRHLAAASSLSTTDAVVLRSTITDRFHEAFIVISRLEDGGHFAEAAPAREIMQVAIDTYMHAAPENTPAITLDLKTFSKFMTETLIERSVAAVS